VTGFFTNHQAGPQRARLCVAVVFATFVVGGSAAEANGGAKYDFRMFPRVGTPTTTFRVSFSAPFAANASDTDYTVEAVGPRRCPSIFDFTMRPIRRGDHVVIKLTPFDDLYFNNRRTWCRGSYVGYVYYTAPIDEPDKRIGYFRFGVGRSPVSLEP
jgi:hypothetical protein